jgi:hypothetical protein
VERSLADEDYCYLTTTGRVSGEPREIEIWFGLYGRTLYMLSGGRDRSNWVKNLIREPRVRVRIADRTWEGETAGIPLRGAGFVAGRCLTSSAITSNEPRPATRSMVTVARLGRLGRAARHDRRVTPVRS